MRSQLRIFIAVHALAVLTLLAAGCSIGDPGYAVAFRNEADVDVIVRGRWPHPGAEPASLSLPAHAAGYVFGTLGYAADAPPIDFEVIDPVACQVLARPQVDLTLGPNPGYSEFIVVLQAGMTFHVETSASGDSSIDGTLKPAATCSETAMTLYVDNNAAMVVVVSVNGTVLRAVQPGFRGELLTFEPNEPKVVSLATQGGTFLASWTMPGPSEAFGFFPDPRCGQVNLWLADPDLTFEPLGPLDESACPR
jgi:hypothetical protein